MSDGLISIRAVKPTVRKNYREVDSEVLALVNKVSRRIKAYGADSSGGACRMMDGPDQEGDGTGRPNERGACVCKGRSISRKAKGGGGGGGAAAAAAPCP